ncbi:MAG: glycosyltransferase family 4 protein [Eubacterium sp.]|nr:glycosyltransferase family 4 protein [Eubacterium sp.]MCC8173255.1 glycosyltransferase family 4 protein [Odoribacter sp.]
MNIYIVSDTLCLSEIGGVGSFTYDLCAEIVARHNGKVFLIGVVTDANKSDPFTNNLKQKGVVIYNLEASSRKDAVMHCFKYSRRLHNFLADTCSKEKNVLNLHLKLSVLIGAMASIGIKKCACVETYHNTYHHYFLQCTMLRPLIDKYICVSAAAKKEMKQRFFLSDSKLVSIPNGVNRAKIRSEIRFQQEDFKYNENILNVVSVGRLSYEKNFTTTVKAFADFPNEKYTYILIGDGPQREEIQNIAKDVDYIKIAGQLSRKSVFEYLSRADIVVMPSLWEGRSILMLEAMAFDVPLMISDVPGLRDVFDEPPLRDDERYRRCSFGYLVKTNDCKSYQEALKDFINNRYYSIEFRKTIRKYSELNDITKVADRYLEVFDGIFEA